MNAIDRRIEAAKDQAATRQAERHGNMGNRTNHAGALASAQVAANSSATTKVSASPQVATDHIREQPNMVASPQIATDHIRLLPNMIASPQAPAQVVRNPFHRYRASAWWVRFFEMEES